MKETNKRLVRGMFTFDGPLYRDKNGVYCSINLTNEMFERFFTVVDRLYVVVRVYTSTQAYDELNLKPLNTVKMHIIEVDNFLTPMGLLYKKHCFEKNIRNIVTDMDLIFARMPSTISNSILKIVNRLKKPYLVEVGGCAWDSFWNHSFYGKIVAPYMYVEEKKYIKNAAFATYVTKQFLQKRYPNSKVTTNCSNVYLGVVHKNVLEQRLKKIAHMDVNKVVFGQAVSSIDVRYKGEHYIIRVMAELKKKGIIIDFQIVGPGDGDILKSEAIKYGVYDQLHLLGTMKKDEIIEWYKTIDIYVQPSRQEGLPRSVIEAMSVGCPVLGSNIAGIPELLDKECLFNPSKNKEIIIAIEKLLDKEIMSDKARTNFYKAKDYEINVIEARRQLIFKKYRDLVMGRYF